MIETINEITSRKAIKDHKCDLCSLKISKGEIYYRATYLLDYIYSWKTHIDCDELFTKMEMHDNSDGGVTADDFYNNIIIEYQDDKGAKDLDFKEALEYCKNKYLKK